MKLPTAVILCFSLPKFAEGIFVAGKIAPANAPPPFDTTSSTSTTADDVPSTFEKATALLMTVPVDGNFKKTGLDKVASTEGSALAPAAVIRSRGLTTTKNKFAAVLGTTSPTQWAILLSSILPISLLDKIIGAVLGKSMSFQQQDIVRVALQEYQVLARMAAASMSLPPQYTKAIWIAYLAKKALPQRSHVVSLMASAVVLLRSHDLPGRLQGFSKNMAAAPYRSQIPAVLAGMSLLPLLFYGARSVGMFANAKSVKSPFVLATCLLTPEELIFSSVGKPMVRSDATELRTSLASVPLNRLIAAAPSMDHVWKDSRYYEYTKPAVQLWRIGTSVQFWQSIYHAVKHDEYYCLVEDEPEPVAIA
jgi:hypothetical protein